MIHVTGFVETVLSQSTCCLQRQKEWSDERKNWWVLSMCGMKLFVLRLVVMWGLPSLLETRARMRKTLQSLEKVLLCLSSLMRRSLLMWSVGVLQFVLLPVLIPRGSTSGNLWAMLLWQTQAGLSIHLAFRCMILCISLPLCLSFPCKDSHIGHYTIFSKVALTVRTVSWRWQHEGIDFQIMISQDSAIIVWSVPEVFAVSVFNVFCVSAVEEIAVRSGHEEISIAVGCQSQFRREKAAGKSV